MAGGEAAVFRAVEGAEDDADAGAAAVDGRAVGPADVVLGHCRQRADAVRVGGIATGGRAGRGHGAAGVRCRRPATSRRST